MVVFSLSKSFNLAGKLTLSWALTAFLEHRDQAKFFLMYIKLSLSTLVPSSVVSPVLALCGLEVQPPC